MENKPYSSSFCSFFWNHLCVRPDHKLQPCCRFEMDGTKAEILDNDFLKNGLNSNFRKILRENALSGHRIPGCSKCYQQEESGIGSLRQVANQVPPGKTSVSIDASDIESLELFVGDICNLKCMMCGPSLSSLWRQDYDKLGWEIPPRSQNQDTFHLVKELPNLRDIKFVGGEPLLSDIHHNILRLLFDRNPSDVTLTYFSNGTVWPKLETLEQWKSFQYVNLWLSIDGIGAVNDYIRYPSKWKEVKKVLYKFIEYSHQNKNLNIRVMTTVSVYNIWNLNRLEKWFFDLQLRYGKETLQFLHLNPLVEPQYLSILNLPDKYKEMAIDQLDPNSEGQGTIISYLKNNQMNLDPYLVDYTRKIDSVRGVQVKQFIPEIEKLLIYLDHSSSL